MKILQIAHGFPPTIGGVESHIWDLSHQLAQAGHEVLVVTGRGQELVSLDDSLRVVVEPSLAATSLLAKREGMAKEDRHAGLAGEFGSIWGRYAKDFHPDVVHAHNMHRYSPDVAPALLGAFDGTPVVHTIHDLMSLSTHAQALSLEWAHTICVSQYLLDGLKSSLLSPSSVLPVGIDVERYATARPNAAMDALESPVIFHPARLLRWKGPDIGLQAFLHIRRRLGHGSLVMCDSSAMVRGATESQALRDELQGVADEAGVGEHVHFLQIDKDAMAGAMAASDLVWYPTNGTEALGIAPIESMAAGKVTIVSDAGGLKESVVPDVSGLRVAQGSIEDLYNAAMSVLTDDTEQLRLSGGATERARYFDSQRITNALADLYGSLVTSAVQA